MLGGRDVIRAGVQLDGEAITWARSIAAELGIDLLAGSLFERGATPRRATTPASTSGLTAAAGRLSQDPPVRRHRRRDQLRRGRHPGGRRGDRRLDAGVGAHPRHDGLLRPALSRAVSDPHPPRGRGDRRAGGVHADDDARPLGGAGAGARDREPGVHARPQPDRQPSRRSALRRALADRRPVGCGPCRRAGRRDRDRRRPRSRGPARGAPPAAGAHPPPARGLPVGRR